ncbi:MAG: glycosyltransferase family 39 protein [Burkholderiales bacterium]|nr:glycosyltransferase family 39 protein [Bacteroidia bacterium]
MDFSFCIVKHKYKLAFLFCIAYLCLSLYKIGDNSLWYDECFSIDWANDSISDIINFSLKDINPPLYLIILHYWMLFFGESEIALRSLSALAASASCGLLFLFALRFFNWQTAIFSTLLFFTSNELYYYSQEGRTYGLVILFTVLSNFAYMSLVKNPNYKNAVLLGIFNAIIFYLHTLACFTFIGQILLIPFLTFNKFLFSNKENKIKTFLGFKLKHITCYLFSWITFGIFIWPWKERLMQLLTRKQKVVWSSKPTLLEFKNCLFDFHNSEILFYVYFISLLLVFIIITYFKKYRETSFNYKLLLVPLILGPFLLWLNYFLAVNITPIFVKRYVLFTILGFILMYAYMFSLLKIDLRIKMGLFIILIVFSAINMRVPRESNWDFKEGVELLLRHKNSSTYISTDMPLLFSYYVDRKTIFKAQEGRWRDELLNKQNIYVSYNLNWQNTTDFSKYTDLYYTQSFGAYTDPTQIVIRDLNDKFTLMDDTIFKGMSISHYKITIITPIDIKNAKKSIKDDNEWFSQIVTKAKERNVTVDSMLTVDAIWYLKNKK